ncbi:MAG: serine hydrolase domain-containing protein [Bacteroidota bacterium]
MTNTEPQSAGNRRDSAIANDEVEQHFPRLLDELVSRKNIHHAVLAIESGDGALRWLGARGEAHPDGTPMTPETPYWIASVTKMYIATAVLKLHERGLIELDARIADYLPGSLVDGIHRLKGVDYSDRITVRHLLGHSSGLPDFLEEHAKGEKNLFDKIIEQDFSWTIEEAMALVRDELTPYFPPQPLDADRQKIRYSDTNYQLLIAIVEAVSGKSIDQAFRELIYVPLGLEETHHPGTSDREGQPATLWAGDERLDIPLAMKAFGDLSSTVSDQLRFMRGLVRGEVFDNPSTFRLMTEHFNTFGFSLNPRPLTPGWPIEYGLGIMRFHLPRVFTPLHPTPAVVGHTGVSGSWLFYCEELDVVTAGTVDQATAAAVPFRFVPKLLRMLQTARR